jgi:aspartyl/asparaginyl-tRNA synthetase
MMHPYRTHICDALHPQDVGTTARLSGWVHKKRDHGNLLFIDLRDHYGLTQCVIPGEHPEFDALSRLKLESVLTLISAITTTGHMRFMIKEKGGVDAGILLAHSSCARSIPPKLFKMIRQSLLETVRAKRLKAVKRTDS